jgi:DNA polymerase-1
MMRDPECTLCKLHETADVVCQWGFGPKRADVMVVSRMPNSGNYQAMIEDELINAGLSLDRVYFTAAAKCRTFDQDIKNPQVKACRPYLDEEIARVKPKWILAFGNEALYALTGHSGITNYRGQVLAQQTHNVVATVAPGSVNRNPGQKAGWTADIQFFVSQVLGRPNSVSIPAVAVIKTKQQLRALRKLLSMCHTISYDIETTGDTEFSNEAAIVSIAGTTITSTDDGLERELIFTLPLYHPNSPFRKSWRQVLKYIASEFESIPKKIAHNGKFDARWLRHFGVNANVTFDTLLAAHLLDENRVKGLKPLARILLGVPGWAIKTKDLLHTPLTAVLKYNALDTYYTYHLYKVFRQQLIEQPRLLRLYKLMIMPANDDLIDVERHGIWIDRERLDKAIKVSFDTRDEIDEELLKYVPETGSHGWPTSSKAKPVAINFNASNFLRWWLFDYLEFPVIERGKDKADGRVGDPSVKEAVMLELKQTQKDHKRYRVIELLLERAKWQKYCSTYVTRYDALRDDNDRIHTTFKLFGTVTGRLSSGKADAEKITGGKTNLRGVNLQQVPRDPFIRGLFGAPPGYTFVEADFSQIELRVVAFLSRDKTMLGIYQRNEDIHSATASWVLGIPMSKVTKDDRKKAKAVNFGFVYGMGAKKFVSTAFEKYELVFSLADAQDIRRVFFERFRGLLPWHNRQRRIVQQYGRVQSPIGRVRHLPDIYSSDQSVIAEAERQAINSPVQSFASDMNLISMILINKTFREMGIKGQCLGLVHDALNFEIHDDYLSTALPIIKDTMENLPLKKWFGVDLDIPIISDIKVGSHWGDAKELTSEEVYDFSKR